jgi:lipopolysaccharide transport system permease protein
MLVEITPVRTQIFNPKELYKFRELFYFLIWRDIKVRYKQTVLGAAWAIFRPLVTMVIFTFLFNKLAGFESGNIPYPVFVLSGVFIWNFFSEGLSFSSQSLINNASLISKTYFPRIIIPFSAVLRGIVDFIIGFFIYLIFSFYYGVYPGINILLFPVMLILLIFSLSGIGMLFSSLSVKYRDIAQILPFFVQLMMWVSPVGYSSSKIPGKYEIFFWMNPMTGIIELSRYSLLGTGYLPLNLLFVSCISMTVLFLIGSYSLYKLEKDFADII